MSRSLEESLLRVGLAMTRVSKRIRKTPKVSFSELPEEEQADFREFCDLVKESGILDDAENGSRLMYKTLKDRLFSRIVAASEKNTLLASVKAASGWVEIAGDDSPRGAAVRFAAASEVLSRESNQIAAAAETIGILEYEIKNSWSSFFDEYVQNFDNENDLAEFYANGPPEEGGVFSWDLSFSRFLERTGTDGKKKAEDVRLASQKRLSRFKAQEIDVLGLFPLWLPKDTSPAFPALVILGQALWRDIVRPQLERKAEAKRKLEAPFRFPQSVGQAMTASRTATIQSSQKKAHGQGPDWVRHVMVDSPGMQLFLEYEAQGVGSTLQSVLTGGLLKTYLLTHAVCADQAGMSTIDGAFAWDERAVYQRYITNGKKVGGRVIDLMRNDMELLLKMRVVRIDGVRMAQPEPLVNRYTEEKSGRSVYVHSKVIMTFVREHFSQIPRAILRLDSRDMPLALGLSTLVRCDAVKILSGGNARGMSVEQLALACGEDTRAGVRKNGTAYWANIFSKLSRIAKDGDLGELVRANDSAEPVSKETLVKLSLHEQLASAYAPLAKAHKAHRQLAARKK